MAKSKARKKREHMLRNTGRDAAASRGKAPDFSTHVRKTKSRRDELAKLHMKHKRKKEDTRINACVPVFTQIIRKVIAL
ncbi:hypothetical protein MOF36_20600 [Bacillus haynesii]|nr:hypothetical protein [Bacillus haynesii]MCY9373246.1 hypothetical protein [Bacillus haynesii]